MKTLGIVFFVCVSTLLAFVEAAGTHNCIHDKLVSNLPAEAHGGSIPQDYIDHPFELAQRREKEGDRVELGTVKLQATDGYSAIRIFLDFTYLGSQYAGTHYCSSASGSVRMDEVLPCDSSNVLTTEKKNYLVNVLAPAAQQWFYSVLSVQPVTTSLKVTSTQCGYVQVPTAAKNGISNTDFVLFVTAAPTSGSTIAWATSCLADQWGRPIAGQANFGPNRLDTAPGQQEEQLSTAIHEISHALGFSSGRFNDFRDSTGRPLGAAKVVAQFTERGHTVTKIITPKVVAAVKEQFGCDQWPNPGGEIEDSGGSGTAGSHWEKRIFRNEYMTGTSSSNPVYSKISLALFEDSGWYKVNYNQAQLLLWGYKAGCSFAFGQCNQWPSLYFCKTQGDTGCSHDFLSKSYCNVATYSSSLPAYYRWFSNPALGGQDQYADFCPFFQPYSNGDCRDTSNAGGNSQVTGEAYGTMARCWVSDVVKSGYSITSGSKSRCFNHRCNGGVMEVQVGTSWYPCPANGGVVSGISGYSGSVTCPPSYVHCATPVHQCATECGARGSCVNGQCVCTPGWKSTPGTSDCALRDAASTISCPSNCNSLGTCDTTTGTCTCNAGWGGSDCSISLSPTPAPAPSPTPSNGACGRDVVIFSQATASADTIFSMSVSTSSYLYIGFSLDRSVPYTITAALGSITGTGVSFVVGAPSDQCFRCSTAACGGSSSSPCCATPSASVLPTTSSFVWSARQTLTINPSDPNFRLGRVLVLGVPTAGLSGKVYFTIVPAATCSSTCKNGGSCQNGVCACTSSWSGSDCSVPVCPNSCSGRGNCITSGGKPACVCMKGYIGADCSSMTAVTRSLSFSVPGTFSAADIAPGSYADFMLTVPDGGGALTIQMQKINSPAADAVLMLRRDAPARLTAYEEVDVNSWASSLDTAMIQTQVVGGSVYVSVYNHPQYSLGNLNVRVIASMTAANALAAADSCPGTPACSGNGNCSSISQGFAQCSCYAGWDGVDCSIGVTQLDPSAPATATANQALASGSWAFFQVNTDPSFGDKLSITASSSNRKPLLLLARRNGRPSLRDFEEMDSDSWFAGSSTSSLTVPAVFNAQGASWYIGVYNHPLFSGGQAQLTLSTAYGTSVCPITATRGECSGRGVCASDKCVCNDGWSGAGCTMLLRDNPDVDMFSDRDAFPLTDGTSNGFVREKKYRVYSVTVPAGGKVSVSVTPLGVGNVEAFATVGAYPKTFTDFTIRSDSAGGAQALTVSNPSDSPTSAYIGLYGQVTSEYNMQATGTSSSSSSINSWQIGTIVAAVVAFVLLIALVVVIVRKNQAKEGLAGQDSLPPVAAPAVATQANEWQEMFDATTGRNYYYNSRTGQTEWNKPANAV